VQILAFPAIWTAPAGKEYTAVFNPGCVGSGEASVFADVAACLGFGFAASVSVMGIEKTGMQALTLNNCLHGHRPPIYYTRYLQRSQDIAKPRKCELNALYSLPV
jgi:hypothetical protein